MISTDSFKNKAEQFITELPHLTAPFNGRNWGHPWHSLCSYHGKLKPAIAHFLVKNFTNPGDVVLDPMSGVGTIPFEACLQGRVGIANDLSMMAFAVSKAKVVRPKREEVEIVINELEKYISDSKDILEEEQERYKDFGFNGKLIDYFHTETYKELIAARQYFKIKGPNLSSSESLVLACTLHVLHGNRPYALSRNSHPLTPYAPTGDFVYKNVVTHIRNKVELSYKKGEWDTYLDGKAIHGDLFNLNDKLFYEVDVIVSSPPFFDSLRFYIHNWMRLWFTGWEPVDYVEAEKIFLEGKQKKDLDIYRDFFKMCANVLKPSGKIILHLGKSDKCDMAKELSERAGEYFEVVFEGSEKVDKIEKHGIKDKGSTTEHQFLFLQKRGAPLN